MATVIFRLAILGAIGVALVLRVPLLLHRIFDPDELQHMHSAFMIHRGLTPHVDYFDHHMPWLHYGLSLIFPLTGESVAALMTGRALMLACTIAILYFTYRLGRQLHGIEVGLLSALLLAYTVMFVEKSLEIRPDVPATVCWTAGLVVLQRARSRWNRRWCLVAGVAMGCAVMLTPKILFGISGIAIALVWLVADRRLQVETPLRDRIAGVRQFVLGLSLPILVTVVLLLFAGALEPFLHQNVVVNAGWEATIEPSLYVIRLAMQNPFLTALGVIGWIVALMQVSPWKNIQKGQHLLYMMPMLTLAIGVWIIPVPFRQYFLPFLPLLAIAAAHALWKAAARLPVALPSQLMMLSTALVGMLAGPLGLMAVLDPRSTNDAQRQEIQYVLDHTAPDETVLNGWRLTGLFRRHAYFYYFLHREVRGMLGDARLKDDVLRVLETVRPRIVENDVDMRELPEEVGAYISQHYEPTGVGDLYRRRD